MDDPNITIEEYIRLEEEKACRRDKVYNWKTATYDKIWYDEDVHDLRSVETELPAIVLNDALTSEVTLSCEPTVSPLDDNKIDFRMSFDESDDEDCTPTVSYFDNLDYFKEFSTIVYNDALTSKLDFLLNPLLSKRHAFWSLNEDILKITSYTPYPSRKIRRIRGYHEEFKSNTPYPEDLDTPVAVLSVSSPIEPKSRVFPPKAFQVATI
ncbi:hypothetical protein Tco_0980815 [Tanacetum coccineum]